MNSEFEHKLVCKVGLSKKPSYSKQIARQRSRSTVKNFLTCGLTLLLFLILCARMWKVQIWGDAGAPPTVDEGIVDPKKHAPTYATCAAISNLVALGQNVWASVEVPKIGGRWVPALRMRTWLTPRNMLMSHLCYVPNLVIPGETVPADIHIYARTV